MTDLERVREAEEAEAELAKLRERVVELEAGLTRVDAAKFLAQETELTRLREALKETRHKLHLRTEEADRLREAVQRYIDGDSLSVQPLRNALKETTPRISKMPVLPMRPGDLKETD